jgi:hypothetical protein
MPDSTTHWCSLCLAERGIRTPAQVDWPGIPICRECAAVTAANVSDEPALLSRQRWPAIALCNKQSDHSSPIFPGFCASLSDRR